MVTLAVTEAIKSIVQAETMFELKRSIQLNFFTEWHEDLPALTDEEESVCDRIKASYLHNSAEGPVSKSTKQSENQLCSVLKVLKNLREITLL